MKYTIIAAVAGLLIGGAIVYFSTPEKIKTVVQVKEVEKVVKQNVAVDRVIERVVTKEGEVREVIKEVDRTVIDSNEQSKESAKIIEHINPKRFSLGVAYKAPLTNLQSPSYNNLGVVVSYDLGVLSSYIQGGVFADTTVMVGIGVRF